MTETTKLGKGAWVAHNLKEKAPSDTAYFKLFGSELAARRYAMDLADTDVTVERLTWGEGRSE